VSGSDTTATLTLSHKAIANFRLIMPIHQVHYTWAIAVSSVGLSLVHNQEDVMDRCHYWLRVTCPFLLTILIAASTAHAQDKGYPDKAVTIICDSAAGSTPDVVARFAADGLARSWHQQVVVINRPGGGGSISAHVAAEAVPDGYTLYLPSLSAFAAQPGLAPGIPLEVPGNFLPIGFVSENPMFIAVNPALGVKTLDELIALAKKRPGKISFAVTGVGRLTHLAGELLQLRADIKLLSVPYTAGPALAMGDVMGGRVDMIIEGYSGIAAAIRAETVKPIAVASAKRLPEFPDLPTAAETIPGFRATGWQILVAPVGTPDAIVRDVSEALAKVVGDPDFRQKLANLGSYSHPMSPAEVTAFVQEEQKTWKPVLERIAADSH
jgi:tripartite-type tricarboxylate transporter receptor subunit TctC